MTKRITYFCVLIAFPFLALAQSDVPLQANIMELSSELAAPEIEATAWALMEINSGWIVTSNGAEEPLPPASITKLMSNYVVYQQLENGNISSNDLVSISEEAWRAEGSRMFADVNTKIELNHLLKSTVIQSGNDAAIALAEHIAGTESVFASMMNKAAKDLGLQHSFFINSTGLPAEGHTMSASDILLLSAAVIREFPSHYAWYAEKSYTYNEITQENRNKLLWRDDSIDGLKTGYTEAAGYCLVASAERDGQRWIAVVLGSSDQSTRERQVLSLLNYGFAAYEPLSVLDEQGGVASARVYYGENDEILLRPPEPVNIVVPRGQEENLQIDLQMSPHYEAPIQAGETMGIASLTLNGELLGDIPLIAMSSIEEGGLWKRLTDSISLWVSGLMSDE